jgi:hypothetical protein
MEPLELNGVRLEMQVFTNIRSLFYNKTDELPSSTRHVLKRRVHSPRVSERINCKGMVSMIACPVKRRSVCHGAVRVKRCKP